MATVLIHMVPEVRESFERAKSLESIPPDIEFPFAELLICLGKLHFILSKNHITLE